MFRFFNRLRGPLDESQLKQGQMRMKKLFNLALTNQNKGRGLKVVMNKASDEASIYVYDAIGWFGVTAEDFVKEVQQITASTIDLYINSPGGVVFDARAMKTALERHPAKVIAHIDGLAASAASFLMLGADEIEIAEGAFVMIHDPWGIAFGTASEMRDTADMLDKLGDSIVGDYHKATGASDKQIRAWMSAETWFDADEALEHGFCDRKAEKQPDEEGASAKAGDLVFNLSAFEHAPKALSEPRIIEDEEIDRDMEQARSRARSRLKLYEQTAPSA